MDAPVQDQLGAFLVPWEPWCPGVGAGYAPNPEFPRPPPGDLTAGHVLAEMPRGHLGARRMHILVLQEW